MKRLSGGNFVYGNPCLELEIIDGTEIRLLVVLFFSAFHTNISTFLFRN